MKTPKRLQLVAFGEPSDVIELNTVSEPVLGQEEVLVSMEAAPLNPSDFLLVRGIYGLRPAFPFSVGAEGVGRVTQTGSKGMLLSRVSGNGNSTRRESGGARWSRRSP
jgi:NADPH:quinone reductase-like Zn-dependent oxidoreductase